MNLLLLSPTQLVDEHHARVSGRQLAHVRTTLASQVGDTLKVGMRDGQLGVALITELAQECMLLTITWNASPPAALPCTLILALPRPKMLKRILQTCATMGVKEIYLINAWKVEKSYWQSPWLHSEKIEENLILGLEQAGDTRMPTVHQRKLFKPFVEDELPALLADAPAFLAHPGQARPCPVGHNQPCSLAIGPEGGFTAYEVEKLIAAGFEGVHVGPRILRVETAVPALLARLFT